MAKLTQKQKAFCDYYIETGNATEAAIKAGYKKKTARQIGSMNLTKVDISSYIAERLKIIESKRIADAEEVLKYLTKTMRGEIDEEVVVVEGEGEGCSSARKVRKEVGIKERNKAAELLGKRYKLFIDKVEQTVDATVNSTAKLDSILQQLDGEEE